ncbi:MAG: M23 family metallopeptidase, partial [Anaerolineae bacterium]|nr:M23 family metallopeptidase [Anaerolineae bacterium]
GSVPAALKMQCEADLSRANCAVPVRAGDVIGQEGSSGYSRAPHLHLEFGQTFGIVPYPDLLDQDSDGDHGEAVYTAYIYAEQNAAFRGYTPSEVARWSFGELQQASHGPQAEVDVNLVRNGDFDDGTAEWTASGQINWQVREGVMRVTRLRSSDPPDWARFYQDLNYGIAAHTPLEIALEIGNDSAIRKTVAVSILNSAGRDYGIVSCDFAVEPNTPLRSYTVRGRTNRTWANIRLEISVNPPDGAPAALVDHIAVHVLSDNEYSNQDSIECISAS